MLYNHVSQENYSRWGRRVYPWLSADAICSIVPMSVCKGWKLVLWIYTECLHYLNIRNMEIIAWPASPKTPTHHGTIHYGLVVASLYVGMAWNQGGGSNQCISIFMAISSLENKY